MSEFEVLAGHEDPDDVPTEPSRVSTSAGARMTAVVVTGLLFGVVVYLSRILPPFFGTASIYPAVALGPAFGAWFGVWGGIGAVTGTLLTQLPAGMSPLVWLPATVAQGFYAWLPALLYRKDEVRSMLDWVRLAAVSALSSSLVAAILVINLGLIDLVPFDIGFRVVFPVTVADGLFWSVTLGPLLMNRISPYVRKSGLRFLRFI